MGVKAGDVTIDPGSFGSVLRVGRKYRVTGESMPGSEKKHPEEEPWEMPVHQVDVLVDGSPVTVEDLTGDWARWQAFFQLTTAGQHTLSAIARGLSWEDVTTLTLQAVDTTVVVAGVEATQSIQYCNINSQGSGYAQDNSVPLVAQRTTVVRVYVDAATPSPITGSAFLDGSAPILPSNGPIAGKAADGGRPRQGGRHLKLPAPRQCLHRAADTAHTHPVPRRPRRRERARSRSRLRIRPVPAGARDRGPHHWSRCAEPARPLGAGDRRPPHAHAPDGAGEHC